MALERQVASRGAAGAPGLSTAFGAGSVSYRDRFPAILTSTFNSTTGYSWERLVLDTTVTPAAVVEVGSPQTGSYAFTSDNNETLTVGTRGWLEADPNAGGWIFLPEASLPGSGICGGTCGSLVGITTDACLRLELVCHTGEFTDVSESQFAAVFAFGSGGTWTFQTWTGAAWTNFTFNWIGGTGTPVFTFDADGNSVLTIGAGNVLKRRCDQEDATFEGGRQNGFTGDAADLPTDKCASNTFVLRVSCSCCPADGFTGSGWYCVAANPDTCAGGPKVCVDYTQTVPCSGVVTICGGPYASQAACLSGCAGVSSGGTVSCCGRPLAATLYASLSGGEGTLTMTWDGTQWAGSKVLTCGETLHLRYSTACQLAYSCNGSSYQAASGGSAPVCGPPFSHGVFTCDMDNGLVGCVAGSCGSISVTVSE